MADVVGGKVVEAAVTDVTNRAVDSVWRQVGYVWNYKSNICDLENQLRMLKAERESMKHSMDEAKRKGETVEEAATIWCESADTAIGAADDLLAEHGAANKSCFMGYCPNLMTRHHFSRKAIKETIPDLSKVQQDRSSISRISYPMDVQQLERPTNYETLGSRVEIMEEILEALKSTDVNLLGVYGFSGVGKSTLVKQQVVAHVKEKSIFKVVAVANVTHTWDCSKIQQEIAGWLDLEFRPGSTEVRAAQLCARLKQEKNVLIILDDIWGMIPLEEIGIPTNKKDHEGCKILMTSRDDNTLSMMGVQRHFHLQALGEEEAWQLFESKVGDLRISRTRPIAHEVAKRCLGLPVLIVAIATSLRDKDLYEWIDAFQQMQNFDHREMDHKVYSALEVSCNYLEAYAKSLLVLFAQLPSSMLISDLVKFSMGLDLFRNCKTVKAVRNRLLKVVNDLKNSCLLLEDANELHVRIHDVVHSFVAKLASKEHHVFTLPSKSDLEEWSEEHKLEQFTAISLPYCKIPQLPEVLGCPELGSFLLWNDDPSLKMSQNFFSRTKKLKLLGLLGGNILPVLPSSLGFLENLQTLCLHGCVLEDTRTIGELKKLRVLSINSYEIVRLPMEIRNLTRLQLLDLSGCERLKVVPPGILNCLTKLEELCMLSTLVHWESEELKNASLSELKSLPNLINLEIHIRDVKMVPADLFHKKLERFRIFIGSNWYGWGEHIPSKLLKLKLNSDAELQRVKVLLAETENLHLDDIKGVKNVVPQLERRGFPELKELFVKRCNEMELIVDDKRMGGVSTFSSSSFSSLKKLTVDNCNALRYFFSFSMFRCLTQLQELDVGYCQNLEMIVGYEDGDDDSDDAIIKLTHLVKLALQELPRLACFCSPIANEVHGEIARAGEFDSVLTAKIQFPNLEELKLSSLKVKKIWNNQCIEFCQFEKLKSLGIRGCGDLAHVLTSSMVRSLAQLKEFWIADCKSMVEVITRSSEAEQELVFCSLLRLYMVGLPKVENFCTSSVIRCPFLEILFVEQCPRLHRFVSVGHVGVSDEAFQQDSTLFDAKIEFHNLEDLTIQGPDSLGPTWGMKRFWNDGLHENFFHKLNLEDLTIEGPDILGLKWGMKRLWNDELHENSFHKLKILYIYSVKEMVKLFPSNWGMKRFQNLEELTIRHCDALTEVFEIGESVDDVANYQLRKLKLWNLPSLKHIWREDPNNGFVKFGKLSDVVIYECPSLKTVFPSSVAKGLVHLETLQITNSGIEQIGEWVDDVANSQLRKLDLGNLPNPKHLWRKHSNNGFVKFGKLSDVCIDECPRLKTVFPSSVAKGLLHLETLRITNSGIEQIVGGDDGEEVDGAALFEFPMLKSLVLRGLLLLESFCPATNLLECPALQRLFITHCNGFSKSILSQDKIFPNLEELTLDGKEFEMIRQGQLQKFNFLKLKVVELDFLKDDSCSLPIDVLHMFDNLETLKVRGGNFKELFPTEGLADDEKHQMICTKIRSLELDSIFCLRTLWNEVLQTLESLSVFWCHNLINLAPSSASFKCLTSLKIHKCGGMLSLVTASTAKSFVQLKTLKVANCDQLKVVVSDDEGEETTGEITFNQLKTLQLESLPNLAIFSSVYHMLKFPCLIDVDVIECPNMELFSKGVSTTPLLQHVQWAIAQSREACYGDLNSTISLCYRKMVGLRRMQHLKVSEHPNVKNRWNRELPVELLSDLKSLVVDDIAISSYAVPSKLLEFLNNLEKLEVSNSEVVEEIFDVQIGSGAECERTDLLSFLKSIHLINLPRLRNIWNVHPRKTLNFKRLNSLKVHHCSSLKTILTPSGAEALLQLREIEVRYCDSVEEIISKGAGSEVESEIIFPMLQSIKLESLPALASLSCGSKVLKCPSLKQIEIADCPVTFTRAFLRQLQSNASEQTTDPMIQLSITLTKLRFSSIYLEKIWHSNCLDISLYGQLTSLVVDGCGNLSFALTPSMVRKLAQLERLEICDCKSIEEVVGTEGETQEEMAFPKLIFLRMKGLQKVVKFCTSNLLHCPSLKKLCIENCPRLQRFLSPSNNAGLQDSTLFDEKVEFPNLEDLEIVGVNELEGLWGNELREDSFNKLKYLNVRDAEKIVRIFPPNLLRRFNNLEKLYIHGCDAIKEVFDIKALIDLKERGGVVVTQLKKLWVYNTPNLLHVWNEDPNRILDFAKLSLVDIDGCSSLQCVFPASVARGLVHLEELYICDSGILHIIAPDEEDMEGEAAFKFHKLEFINLRRLPQLERILVGTHSTEFPELKKLFVAQCDKLQQPSLLYKKAIPSLECLTLNGKEVSMIREGQLAVDMFHQLKCLELNFYDDSSNVFPFDLFHLFHNLETLCVVCSKFADLFSPEGPDVDHENQCRTILKKVRSLNLYVLPNLKTFWNEVLESLETLYVEECGSLIILAPSLASFHNLTSLEVYKCKGLVSLVTSSTAKSLLRLKTWTVSECNELKVIVSDDDEHEKATHEIIFLKLETLELDRLSSLSSFCGGNHSFRFPCLVKVIVKQCPNMEFFSKGVSTTPILPRVQLAEEEDSGYWLGNLNSTVTFLHKKAIAKKIEEL